MNPLQELIKMPARWRRSHGFGVHSPFAFSFITKVLREKETQYYAFPEISAFCPRARKAGFNEIFAGRDLSEPEAHLLFRLLCYFNPQEVVEIGHGHEVTNIVFARALPHTKVHFADSLHIPSLKEEGEPFILINNVNHGGEERLASALLKALETRDYIIEIRNLRYSPSSRRVWKELMAGAPHGMSFTDRYTGIFVGRHTLPRQHYDIYF